MSSLAIRLWVGAALSLFHADKSSFGRKLQVCEIRFPMFAFMAVLLRGFRPVSRYEV